MRGLGKMALVSVILPVAGGIAALSPRVHVVPFSTSRFVLRIHRAATPTGETFEKYVSTVRPRAAFNGTYYGEDGQPLGILRSEGKWVFRGGRMQTVFAVDRSGRPLLLSRDAVRKDPSRYPFAIAAGPRLLKDGANCVNPESEGFRAAARKIRASRVALGVRRDGMALVIVDEDAVTLNEFAAVCRKAGAVDAVNLDGGGATALYHRGKTVVSPMIPMADIVTISDK
ncbi:MAG TPA: phosphodiester glycosidase family protein [Armatimonadota bacterium]|jgi:exopolysaccharide biosynthesis protein